MSEEFVVLVRLSGEQGFFTMGDVLELTGQLNLKGIQAVAEQSPAALMDAPQGFFIKVPVEQFAFAQQELKTLLTK
ncbi:MAG: hypothetical protein KDD40_10220 [Bdellovibrionales bacterium]|nr:hypothetical protein [Bdellovibrionales bacterium]